VAAADVKDASSLTRVDLTAGFYNRVFQKSLPSLGGHIQGLLEHPVYKDSRIQTETFFSTLLDEVADGGRVVGRECNMTESHMTQTRSLSCKVVATL
jgi:hypothetical protein